MNFVSDLSELWKGLSDIPLALLAGIFAFSFSSKKRPAALPETEPAALPETEPAALPETELTASSETEPVASSETEPVASSETEPAASSETDFSVSFASTSVAVLNPDFSAQRNSLLFAGIGLSSFMGIILHCFDFTRRQLDYGWTLLYLLLYFCLWLFYGAMVSLFSRPADVLDEKLRNADLSFHSDPSLLTVIPPLRTAGLFFGICYVITVAVLYIFEGPDIFIFAAAALLMVIPLVSLVIKHRHLSMENENRPLPRGFGLLFLFLLLAVCCQFLSKLVPFIVAGEHVFLCAALCCLQRILR